MSIHDETEADTRAERIDPVLAAAGWDIFWSILFVERCSG